MCEYCNENSHMLLILVGEYERCDNCQCKLCPKCNGHTKISRRVMENYDIDMCDNCGFKTCDPDTIEHCYYCLDGYCKDDETCSGGHDVLKCGFCGKKNCSQHLGLCEYCNKYFCYDYDRFATCKSFKDHYTKCDRCGEESCKNSSKWCDDCEKYFCDDECYDSGDHKTNCLYCERMFCYKEHKCDKDYVCCCDGICKKCVSKLDKYAKLKADCKALEVENTHLKYAPGGAGYQEAKEDFEELASTT